MSSILRKSHVMKIILIVVASIIALSILIFTVLNRVFTYTPPSNLCSVQNEVFRNINNNANAWLERFLSPDLQEIQFNLSENQRSYYAIPTDDGDRFFVIVSSVIRGPLGWAGYIYSPSSDPSSNPNYSTYSFRLLSNNIFCYAIGDLPLP